jgi:enhancing lycopene biosynthesis protein 2
MSRLNRTLSSTPGIHQPSNPPPPPSAYLPSDVQVYAPFVAGSVALFFSAFSLGLVAHRAMDKARVKAVSGKRVAVVLCGAGYLDGSEITESVAVLTALSEFGAKVQVFAPDAAQTDVVDHASSSAKGFAARNMLQESARISRGGVLPLSQLHAEKFDVLVVPGGFGVAKSLSNWGAAAAASDFVEPHLRAALLMFRAQRKVIALCCISPVLAAKTIAPCKLTLGKAGPASEWPYGETVAAVKSIKGVTHVDCEVGEICVDQDALLVTTPAYMSAAPRHEIVQGVREMVYAALRLSGSA